MNNIKNTILAIISIISIVLFITVFNYDNAKAFDSIIYFLTIATGFNVTAFSIIANSDFSKKLYEIEDRENNSQTLLHILVNKFKNSIILFLTTIILILFYKFINDDSSVQNNTFIIFGKNLTISVIIKGVIWYLTIVSLILFYSLVMVFSKFIIRHAATQSSNREND